MSGLLSNSLFLSTAAGGGAGYQIERSLRFNSSDSAYLSRTPAVAGNRKTWTWTGWVKRSELGTLQTLFGVNNGSGNDYFAITLNTSDSLSVTNDATQFINTAQVFRDAAAWMHLVFAVNTANATASDRIILYVNGTRVTSFANTSYPTQNTDLAINSAVAHGIGQISPGRYFNGYLADIHFIDGQALTPSSFTEVSATTGQLIPLAYTGTYGTNGFQLKFADNSSNTAATLGKDTSGNSNNWTPNNFSVATGTSTITVPSSNAPPTVDFLVVAGGGGGGLDLGGGGGGGGLRSSVTATGGGGTLESPLAVVAGATYSVSVGGGGAGATAHASTGSKGGDSTFSTVTATGGGGGKSRSSGTGNSAGGSGGGGSFNNGTAGTGTANQGFNGGTASGYGCGGGGGAGSLGSNTTGNQGGNGGSGVSSSITGSSVAYAGGGGGGSIDGATVGSGQAGGSNGTSAGGATPSPGTANTGGGGGGQGGTTSVSPSGAGGAGGSGIVILRYANTYGDLIVGSSLTYTYANSGGYKIYSFSASSQYSPSTAAGNDSLVDTPTSFGTDTGVGNEVRGNYCTLNPLDTNTAQITLQNGNLDCNQSGADSTTHGTIGVSSGKWYWEATLGNTKANVGIARASATLTNYLGSDSNGWGYYSVTGQKINSGSLTSYGATSTTGDVIGIAFDADNGTLAFYKNGASQGTAFTGLTSGPYFPAQGTSGSLQYFNWGQRAFAYTAPSGFKALCDTNLGAPVVAKPSTVMDVITYTGTGSSLTLPNGSSTPTSISFTPDFAWLKGRSGATDHALYDAVRGVQKDLVSNSTSAETTETTGLTAFGTNTFTVGSLAKLNTSSSTYVAWAWNAGGSTVSNTAGSITSQVRANASAGFSIVTFTGNASTSATVGHGLGVAPRLIIEKSRTASFDGSWWVHHANMGSGTLRLNSTDAVRTDFPSGWINNSPTSTTFSFTAGSGGTVNNVNYSGDAYVAYCFTPVVGYSSFGSYTGNGSADGPFVYTGFRPRWIMTKVSSSGVGVDGDWLIVDTTRNQYNVADKFLFAQTASSEATTTLSDVLSNGFKIRSTLNAVNASGLTYIYMAFAENPFQYARAR